MKYLDEFRNPELAAGLLKQIEQLSAQVTAVKFMEVCGTHTMAIARYGLRRMLPDNIQLISGPGCPVCVTPNIYLDTAIAFSRLENVIITTFGDMLRVPGSSSSLEKERASGADIRIVYSTLDALDIAHKNQDKQIIFLGVGFETTAPTVAASIIQAAESDLANYTVFCAHKTMPAPMAAIARAGKINLNGFICPAHVSTIIGSRPYEFLARDYGMCCVIAGFEPLDILKAIQMLLKQVVAKKPAVEIEYTRVATRDGNQAALKLMAGVFEECDGIWRGLGTIPASGLKIKEQYSNFDAEKRLTVQVEPTHEESGCRCGEVMQGIVQPPECALFAVTCTPENPVGSCMVSSEGTCAAWYKYELNAR
jgi:hydrogenase expression/formation protein HypD